MPTVEQIKTRKPSSLAVDILLFCDIQNIDSWDSNFCNPLKPGLHVLCIGRKNPPYAFSEGFFCFPGGFVDYDEDPYDAAQRELLEETQVYDVGLQLLGVYGKKDRDPRSHVVSIAYCGKVSEESAKKAVGSDDALYSFWIPFEDLLKKKFRLGFDHFQMLLDYFYIQERFSY